MRRSKTESPGRGTTRALARFAAQLQYRDLPAPVIEAAKLAILNILAAALGGAHTRIGRLHLELAQDIGGGRRQSTLIGDGRRVSTALAAYANANLAFALDYEDVCCQVIHAGPIVVPAVLAAAEAQRASGRDVLTAVVAGYEVGTRIGLGMQPSAARGAQVWGQQYSPFASCAAVGRLGGLDAPTLDAALGIAGTYAPVPSAYKYFGVVSETRPMREVKLGWGWMSMAGLVAAQSARAGFGGGYGILDGNEGFWIMAGSDQHDFPAMTRALGRDWCILSTRYKLHPSIAWNHPAHVALQRLLRQHAVRPEDVRRLRAWNVGVARIADYQPQGAVDAQFSLPYTLATTLLGLPLTPALYSPRCIRSPAVRRALAKIECLTDPAMEQDWFVRHQMRSKIELQLRDGRVLVGEITFPDDSPPYGRDDVIRKLQELSGELLPAARLRAIVRAVDQLEKLPDIGALMRLLRPVRAGAATRAARARPRARPKR
jgi:2-methylcitrate dehydratase PrpD